MSKTAKDVVIIMLIWIPVFILYFMIHSYTHGLALQRSDCPSGTYDAGDFCKAEPTGCAYGENIPLDSPKCRPSEEDLTKLQDKHSKIKFTKPVEKFDYYIGK